MTHTTIKHLAMAALFTALTMLAVAPASAQTSSTGHGWERTGNATGQPQSGGGQVSQPTTTTTVEGAHGWEATAVAGDGTTGTVVADSDDSPVSSPSTQQILYVLVGLLIAAGAVFFGARLIRSHQPTRTA